MTATPGQDPTRKAGSIFDAVDFCFLDSVGHIRAQLRFVAHSYEKRISFRARAAGCEHEQQAAVSPSTWGRFLSFEQAPISRGQDEPLIQQSRGKAASNPGPATEIDPRDETESKWTISISRLAHYGG